MQPKKHVLKHHGDRKRPHGTRFLSPIRLQVAALTCFLMVLASCEASKPVVLKEGDPAPGFSLKGLRGTLWNSDTLRNKVILVNFWAPWCKPCKSEMPSLERLHEQTRRQKNFVVLTVLYGNDTLQAMEFVKSRDLRLPVLVDDDLSVSRRFGVTGVPETYIIDKKGIVRKKIIGPTNFDSPGALAFILGLLNEKS